MCIDGGNHSWVYTYPDGGHEPTVVCAKCGAVQ